MRLLLLAAAIVAVATLTSARTERSLSASGTAIISVDANAAVPGPQASGIVIVTSPEIAIDVDVQNADAIGAFEFEVLYDPSYLLFSHWSAGPFLGSTGRALSCHQIVQTTTVRAGCGTVGEPLPPEPSGDGVLATLYFRPRVIGQTCLLMTEAATSDVLGSSLPTSGADGCVSVVGADQDTDGDGCTDAQELGASHIDGGDPDPTNPWDFYDVPVPALNPRKHERPPRPKCRHRRRDRHPRVHRCCRRPRPECERRALQQRPRRRWRARRPGI